MYKLLLLSPGTKWKPAGYFMSLLNQVTSLRKRCLCCLLAIFAIHYAAQAQQLPTGNYADLTNVNGTLYFTANNASGQSCLWKTDGTPAGTELVKNIGATSLTHVNGTLYFATPKQFGYELWKSNGTTAGTVKITDVHFGSWNSEYERPYPNILIKAGNTLLFTSDNSASGFVLNSTTGTKESIIQLTFISLLSDDPIYFAERNNILFFVHRGLNGNDNGLWKSDGSVAGTVRVKEIRNPNMLINVNGTLFFEDTDQVNGDKLWKSDGTETGTVLAQNIVPGISEVYTTHLTNVNGTVFFTRNGNELWKSDGTSAGPVRIKTLSKKVTELAAVGNTLYFFTAENTGELWKSNGTTVGTVLVKDNLPSIISATPQLKAINNTLFFTTNDSFTGSTQKLWKSNGTPEGTTEVFALPVPANFQANAVSRTQVHFRWDNSANADNEEYILERATSPNLSFTAIDTIIGGGDYIYAFDENLQPGFTYYYRVKTVISNANSPYTNVVSVTTWQNPVTSPANATAQWNKRFGGSLDENLQTAIATTDGGYLLVGASRSGLEGDRSQASQGGRFRFLDCKSGQ